MAQENGIETSKLPKVDLDKIRDLGQVSLFPEEEEPYSGVVDCGDIDGVPVVTFTAVPPRHDYSMPSDKYLAMITRGLVESHELTVGQSAEYLWQSPGIDQRRYSIHELASYIGRALEL